MGLLDDAIREHLELKRRRGADPTEVEREEREVLGPVRSRAVDAVEFEDPHAEEEFEHEPLAHREGTSWANGGAEYAGGEVRPPPAAFDHEQLSEPLPGPEPEPRAYPPAGHEPEAYPPLGHEPEPYPGAGHEPAPEPHAAAPHEPDPYPAAGHAPEPEPYPVAGREPEPYPAHKPPDDDPATVEYNVEDAGEADEHSHAEGEKEDVLEETPEFLQDTPDHERLWFEQRPPRDFDFDG
jgi:hypothetical protein